MPSPSYIQAGSITRGIANAQTDINISTNSERFENPKEYILDRFGGRTGFAYDFDKSSTVTISGEVNTADSAVLGVAWGTALTVANSAGTAYGISTGDYLLDDIEITADRGTLKSATATLTRVSGLTVA